MRIVEIAELDNGAHRNQMGKFRSIPDGWAEIPNGVEIPTSFPFVDILFEDGKIVGFTEKEVPVEPEQEDEETDGTESFILEMMADHEERICMIEMGL